MSYTYLASPYSATNPAVMEARYHTALHALNFLLSRNIWAYSPVVHCHHLAKRFRYPANIEFWRDYDRAMLESANSLHVLAAPGWRESEGVTAEIEWAVELNLPIFKIIPGDFE